MKARVTAVPYELGAFAVLAVCLAVPGLAHADDADTDSMSGRHVLEIGVGGGMNLMSDAPEGLDVRVGGQLGGRLALDLVHLRADASVLIPDPTHMDRLQIRGDARLLFLVVRDFTWRTTAAGELLRVFAGLGGEVDLPEDSGHLMMDFGFAMHRLGPLGENGREPTESYGGYVGITARMHIWEIRDELRVAVHGMLNPSDFVLSLDVGQMFGQLTVGATVSNRLYLQALREGAFSVGPELVFSYEGLLEGPVVYATLGLSGTLGL